ncbi:hypothetical protein L7F22_017911 [Adiantum nelumboides]|nr:hypothetical protein [Adiantum nelumboides]
MEVRYIIRYLRGGFGADLVVRGALIDMYAKCNMLKNARRVFDTTPSKSLMLWGLMITGYGQHGEGTAALELYEKMMEIGMKPDKVLFSVLLNVCGNLGALEQGKALHDQLSECKVEPDMTVGNTLIDMYTKCVCLEKACEVFSRLPYREDASWASHAQQHIGQGAIQWYRIMQESGICSNEPFYAGTVSACRHDQGQLQFSDLISADPVSSIMCQYTSIVQTLACIGHMEMASQFLQTMPISPNAIHWISLLSRCRGPGMLLLAQHCLTQIMQFGFTYDSLPKVCQGALMWNQAGILKSSNASQTVSDRTLITVSTSLVNDNLLSLLAELDSAFECKHAPERDSNFRIFLKNYKQFTCFKDYYLKYCFYINRAFKISSNFMHKVLGIKSMCWMSSLG